MNNFSEFLLFCMILVFGLMAAAGVVLYFSRRELRERVLDLEAQVREDIEAFDSFREEGRVAKAEADRWRGACEAAKTRVEWLEKRNAELSADLGIIADLRTGEMKVFLRFVERHAGVAKSLPHGLELLNIEMEGLRSQLASTQGRLEAALRVARLNDATAAGPDA